MQAQRRVTRQRSSTNNDSHDENAGVGRVTRASSKSNVLGAKEGLQSKQSNAPLNRKRAALGDVSNVAATEALGKGGKKKGVLATKAGSGVTKGSRALATRTNTTSTAPLKEKGSEDLKRSSSSAALGPRAKKRNTSSSSSSLSAATSKSIKSEGAENEAPAVKTSSIVTVEISKKTKTEVVVEQKPAVKLEEQQPKVEGQQEEQPAWDNLDDEDANDPLMVSEYVVEIFEYLKEKELETQPNPEYMDHQEELQWKMRGILVDWLIEVHLRFHLLPETLFLAVNIVDRFLTNKFVSLDKLQLVGVTAMFIAAKYEEVFSPSVKNFIYVADGGYTEEEILRAERYILQSLDFNLSYPNPMNFLRRISKADNYDIQTRTIAKYLMEVSLLDHRFIKYLPSQIAAAAMYMARKMYDKGAWDANLEHYSEYSEKEIQPIFRLMMDYLARPVKHEAFFKKYASKKFMKASLQARTWSKKHAASYNVNVDLPEDQFR